MNKKRIIAAFTKNAAPKAKPIPAYDRAQFHDVEKLDLPFTSALIPGGMVMGWAVSNRLLAQGFYEENASDVGEFLDGVLTCTELYRWLGGYLHQTMFLKDCSMFLHAYYGNHKHEGQQEKSVYWDDLKNAMQAEGTIYHIADSASNFAKVKKLLDARYTEFQTKVFSHPSQNLDEIQWSKLALADFMLDLNSAEWLEAEYKKLHKYDGVVELPLVEDEFYFTHASLFILEKDKTPAAKWDAGDYEKGYVSEPGYVQFNLLASTGVAKLSIQLSAFVPNDSYESVLRLPFEVGEVGVLEVNSVNEVPIFFSIKPGNYILVLAQYITEEDTRLGDLEVVELFFEPVTAA